MKINNNQQFVQLIEKEFNSNFNINFKFFSTNKYSICFGMTLDFALNFHYYY